MQKQQPEKGKAPVGGTTEALSEANPYHKESNMSDSKAVQVSVQPVFNFGEHVVRVVTIEGEPWFVATDVCAALDLTNPSKAMKALEAHERSNFKLGRQGEANIINESGLYTLILRCRDAIKPGTTPHKFKTWVTSEVLPAIRKTGVYVGKPFTVNPGDVLTAEEQNTLRLMLKSAVERLPKEKQAGAMVKGWSKLKAHFGVPYREIPRQEFSEAVSIIARHTAEWELVEEAPEPPKSYLKATVKTVGRYDNGDWGLYVICGECGFGVRVGKKAMRQGGVQPGDLIRLEYLKTDNPLAGPFTKVILWSEYTPPVQDAGKIAVDRKKLAAILVDLGRLCKRLDGLGILESDLPPSWWQANAISEATA